MLERWLANMYPLLRQNSVIGQRNPKPKTKKQPSILYLSTTVKIDKSIPTAFGSFSLTCGQAMFWLQLKLVVGRRVLSVGGPQGAIVLCSGFVSQDLLGYPLWITLRFLFHFRSFHPGNWPFQLTGLSFQLTSTTLRNQTDLPFSSDIFSWDDSFDLILGFLDPWPWGLPCLQIVHETLRGKCSTRCWFDDSLVGIGSWISWIDGARCLSQFGEGSLPFYGRLLRTFWVGPADPVILG